MIARANCLTTIERDGNPIEASPEKMAGAGGFPN